MSSTCQRITRGLLHPLLCVARPFLPTSALASVLSGERMLFGDDRPTATVAASTLISEEEEIAFEDTANAISASKAELSNALKLRLYALYKQSVAGDASATPPPKAAIDPVVLFKWRAWAELRGMSCAESMRLYVSAAAAALSGEAAKQAADGQGSVNILDADDETLDMFFAGGGGGFGGAVQSSLAGVDQEDDAAAIDEAAEPLHCAARLSYPKLCRELLESGHPVDSRDAEEHTPLHWACDVASLAVVQCLLEFGACPNAQNVEGSTPLHMACARDSLPIASLLVKSGAELNRLDCDGCSPLGFGSAKLTEQLQPLIEGRLGSASGVPKTPLRAA